MRKGGQKGVSSPEQREESLKPDPAAPLEMRGTHSYFCHNYQKNYGDMVKMMIFSLLSSCFSFGSVR